MMGDNMFDVIVIGGGPAGMMAAIMASSTGKKVLLCERNAILGKKMLISGGGRCNITNYKSVNEFISALPAKNGRFLYTSLTQFGPAEIYDFFTTNGIPLKIENQQRVFPVSDRAQDFVTCLSRLLAKHHVQVMLETEVLDIVLEGSKHTIYTSKGIFTTKNLVIATGGVSYPHTGSTGFGHQMAKKYQHDVTPLFPTESPILSNDPIIQSKALQGLTFTDIEISLYDAQHQVLKTQRDALIFTHFGLSGPAALKLSQFVYHEWAKSKQCLVSIDFFPDETVETMCESIKSMKAKMSQKSLRNGLAPLTQERLLTAIFNMLNLNSDMTLAHLNQANIQALASKLKSFPLIVHGVKPLSSAFVTGGGVDLKAIHPKTMESKIIPGLYFVGEVLDLHGYTGGYNITIALSTGYAAGKAISET